MVQIEMDSWELDDFEKELELFSEIPTTEEIAPIKTPRIIEDYNARINSNRTGSIFDNHYDVSPECAKLDDDHEVTYVISGRGRGGRNTYYKPGGPIKGKVEMDNDEEVRQELRKVSGLGYSNEIIQLAVKREQAKSCESSPQKSRSTSRMETFNELPELKFPSEFLLELPELKKFSSESPSSKSFESTEKDIMSHTEDEIYQDARSSTPSTNSSITDTFNNNNNSNNNMNGNSRTPENEENYVVNSDMSLGAIPKKPLPLSQMLKQTRQNRIVAKTIKESQSTVEVPTIVKNEPINGFNRKKLPTLLDVSENKNATVAENTNIQKETKREENSNQLPWRRRDRMSPPRFVWGAQRPNTTKMLDIRSTIDFPTLK